MKPLQENERFEGFVTFAEVSEFTGESYRASTDMNLPPSGTDAGVFPDTPSGTDFAVLPDAFEDCKTSVFALNLSRSSSSIASSSIASSSTPSEGELEEFCHRAFDAGRMQARRIGVAVDSVDDCALGFVAHILVQVRERKGTGFEVTRPWLLRCAANWARNECRSQRRRRWRECLSADLYPNNEGTASVTTEASLERFSAADDACRSNASGIESEADIFVLRQELEAIVRIAVALLPPSQHTLWTQFYVEEQSITEIALHSGKKPNAVRQSLWALRQRIRALLQSIGLDEAEAAEYLVLLRAQQQGSGP